MEDQNQEVPAAETHMVEMETPAPEKPVCEGGESSQPEKPVCEGGESSQPEKPVCEGGESSQPEKPVCEGGESSQPEKPVCEGGESSQPEQLQAEQPPANAPMQETADVGQGEADASSETHVEALEKLSEAGKPEEVEELEKKPQVAEKSTDEPEQKLESSADVAVAPPEVAKEVAPVAKAPEVEPEKLSEEVSAEVSKEAEPQTKEAAMPLFFGWFLLSEVEEKMKCSTMEFLKTLDTLQAFKKHLGEFTGEAEKEVDLEQYFQTNTPFHCTTKFCDYGKSEGSREYAELRVVTDAYGSAAELAVTGLMVTPRTFGARIALTPEQLQLWPPGEDKEGVPASILPSVEALPVGSRAHVTLGCAAGVEAVQTGLDLLEVLVLQQAGHQASTTEELDAGTLSYMGEGRWYLELREAIVCDATFSSFSEDKHPTEPAKKEGGEKKKKPKCSIL